MRAFFSFLYGLAAYAASLAALLYLMGFTANRRVPTSVDVGTAARGARRSSSTCCCWRCSACSTA